MIVDTTSGASESKKCRVQKNFEQLVLEFDDTLDGTKERWDRASGKGQKLSTLMRDTDSWIHRKFKRNALEFMRVSGEDRLKAETQKFLEETKENVLIALAQLDTLWVLMEETIEIVHSCEHEEDLLEQMDKLTKRLHELHASS